MNSDKDKIAVIGMACRFPGANNINEFWRNLIEGRDTITHFTDEELQRFEYNYELLRDNPDFVKARGIISDIDKFDAEFFGISPEEAAETDPQHRVWLETAWEAFENAGCDPLSFPGIIGVFAGGSVNTYLLNNVLRDPVKFENFVRMRSKESLQVLVENDATYIPTKTAYHFNLRGPAINVQTACSTSLVAIAQACQSLFSYESDICLAGGVCIISPQESGYVYQQGAIHSPDGTCRPFDVNGNGTIFSNGVGIVVLERLEDALRDRDMIYAIVSGWALNNDGKNKVSFMAPSVEGQADVIRMAYTFAGISPDQIGYIEAHGSGTQLGDPVEVAGLKKAFSGNTDKKQFCGIGSVKGNIGHTDTVAGVAGFIKICLAAYNRIIPPTIHFSAPNKYIKFENSPFYVHHELKEWTLDRPMIMGVSSFGIGGTNAHAIVEEPPRRIKTIGSTSEFPELILLSAKSEESLLRRKRDLIDFVSLNPDANLKDLSFTLSSGRSHMTFRSYMVASDISEIKEITNFQDGRKDEMISKIAFMFPGQGAQYVSMGSDLYKSNRLFSQILDECFEIIKSETGEDFYSLLFETSNIEERELKLARTEFAQPALFIIEYALVKILEQIGIRPDFLIGHSIGEYSAACVAGVFDLPSALKIIIKRGQLMQKMPEVNMMTGHSWIKDPGSADNTAELCSEFGDYVTQFRMNIPEIPFISCLTGNFITPEQAVSGVYWEQQMRNPVQFISGVSMISENDDVLFLELGPNTQLSLLVGENSAVKNKKAIISTLLKDENHNENYSMISALGKMYNAGLDPVFHSRKGNGTAAKISLPVYPFKRERHWIDFEHPNNQEGRAGF